MREHRQLDWGEVLNHREPSPVSVANEPFPELSQTTPVSFDPAQRGISLLCVFPC